MKPRTPRFLSALALIAVLAMGAAGVPTAPDRSLAAPAAPALTAPAEGQEVTGFGPTLTWENPAAVTQYHLQVFPANNDGPGVNLHVGSAATSFSIPPPPGWYGLLPDMTYTWRVRVSDASSFASLDDPSWSPWSERRFRTPRVSSDTISLSSPAAGGTVSTETPVLSWSNSRSDIFYYEVQVSRDATFNTDPATATAMVYWELVHGGVAQPNNSYRVPAGFPLQNNTLYNWRVRPRVQGDGVPVPWSAPSAFTVDRAAATPTPIVTVTPTPTATPTATPTPSAPPAYSGERLAFVSLGAGGGEIWAVRADGTGLVNLTKSPGTDDYPVWSRDGKKLAFVTERHAGSQSCGNAVGCYREIYVMDADGKNPVRVTTNMALEGDPAWSPDGTRLVFVSRRDGPQHVYRANADGTGATRLTTGTASHWYPLWSPDGTKILYGSSRANDIEMFTAAPDGSGEVALVKHPAQDYSQRDAWSPDGSKIVFQTSRDGKFEIYSMNADGTEQKNLTNSSGEDMSPAWSPDGKKIAFVSDRDGNLEVYVMNADGTGQTNVSNSAAEDCSPTDCLPAWSPDSTRVAFVSRRDGNKEIYVVKTDGTGLKRVTQSEADDIRPVWAR